MGNSHVLPDHVRLIANDRTWIEGQAVEQLIGVGNLAHVKRVVGLPDLHPGRGYPVGAAVLTEDAIYPALVGNDIGCGMGLWRTDLKASKAKPEKWIRRLADIDAPLGPDWRGEVAAVKESLGLPAAGGDAAIGTIGGGNHFAELQALDAIVDEVAFIELGLDPAVLYLLVHSGSRGLGQAILSRHVRDHGHNPLTAEMGDFDRYRADHDRAMRWAAANRRMIAARIMEAVRCSGWAMLDVTHNMVEPAGAGLWLHRKGATPTDRGPVMIPGSRGDHSYLVVPLDASASLDTVAHGAGRKWARSDCKARLSGRYKAAELTRTKLGSHVLCADRELLYEEAPEAYKPADSVVAALVEAGLVRVVARFRPVLTIKRGGGCR